MAMLTPLTMAATLTDGRYKLPPHLRHLDRLLLELAAGRIRRLLVMMPPRHGKSEACSHWFPTWLLAIRPDTPVILASYEASFAATWGRKVRDSLIRAHEYGLCPVRVRQDVSAVGLWSVEGHAGGMRTAGVGGGITGHGAGLLVVDDPTKNAEEANSATYRDRAWEWWQSTALTRLEPDASVILIATRWHEDDLPGRVLEQEADDWEVVRFPALAEEADVLGRKVGEALWRERYPAEALAKIKATIGTYWWTSLYGQRPTARGGGMIPVERIQILSAQPTCVRWVRFWDLGGTEDGGDPSAGLRMGLMNDGRLCISDVRHFQKGPGETRQRVAQAAASDGREVAIFLEQEPGQSGKDQIENYARTVVAGYAFRGIPSTGDKVLRADPFAAAVEAGNVCLVAGPWNGDFLDECEKFPHGARDDQVDAAGGAYTQLTSEQPVIQTISLIDLADRMGL